MKLQLKTSVFLLLLLCISCVDRKKNYEDCHHYMTIVNNSDEVIYAIPSYGFPDTMGFQETVPNPILDSRKNKVPANSQNDDALEDLNSCLELSIGSDKLCPSHRIMIFLFKEDSLKANDWKDAPNYVLKRYDLTIDDLNALNWTIAYL